MMFDALGWFALGQIDLEGAVPDNEPRAWPPVQNNQYQQMLNAETMRFLREQDDEEVMAILYG